MKMNWLLAVALILEVFVTAEVCRAAKVEFPDGELARESVLPVFEPLAVLKKRRVPSDSRFELHGFGGATLNDAFFSPLLFGGDITYHLSNYHGIQVLGAALSSSTSTYASQLKTQQGLDFSKAPGASYMALGVYEFTPYYGKISITKQGVMNMAIYATGGVGMVGFSNSSSNVLFSFGIGQKLYFSPNFGLKFDLRSLIYSAPDPLSASGYLKGTSGASTQFSSHMVYNAMITVGAIFLLPTL